MSFPVRTIFTRLRQNSVWEGNEIKISRLWALDDDKHMNVAKNQCFSQIGQTCVHHFSTPNHIPLSSTPISAIPFKRSTNPINSQFPIPPLADLPAHPLPPRHFLLVSASQRASQTRTLVRHRSRFIPDPFRVQCREG